MDEEQYVFEVEHFGRLEMKGEKCFQGFRDT